MSKNSKSIKNISVCALFCALISVLAQISAAVTPGINLTLQTLAVALCGYFLPLKLSLLSVTSYIVLGAIGIPVYSSFTGGLGILFGKSGGFIIGFLLLCIFFGIIPRAKPILRLLFGLLGLIPFYLLGSVWFVFITNTKLYLPFLLSCFPLFLKDAVCILLAFTISERLKKRIKI